MSTRDVYVTFRTTAEGCAAIDELAALEDRDRSSMVRVLLGEAVRARMARPHPGVNEAASGPGGPPAPAGGYSGRVGGRR